MLWKAVRYLSKWNLLSSEPSCVAGRSKRDEGGRGVLVERYMWTYIWLEEGKGRVWYGGWES